MVKKLARPTGTTQKTATSRKFSLRFAFSLSITAMLDVSQSCTQYAPVKRTEIKIHAGRTNFDFPSATDSIDVVM